MKIFINTVFFAIWLFIMVVCVVILLQLDMPLRPMLSFGQPDYLLNSERLLKKQNIQEEEEKLQKELEVQWGKWNADIYNALVIDYLNNPPRYNYDANLELSFTVTRHGKIKNIKAKSNYKTLEEDIIKGVKSLEYDYVLNFPELSQKEENEFRILLRSCSKSDDPYCAEKRREAVDFPKRELYQEEIE